VTTLFELRNISWGCPFKDFSPSQALHIQSSGNFYILPIYLEFRLSIRNRIWAGHQWLMPIILTTGG
jgi:hypothetical protein